MDEKAGMNNKAENCFSKVVFIKYEEASSGRNFLNSFLSMMRINLRRLKAVNINPTNEPLYSRFERGVRGAPHRLPRCGRVLNCAFAVVAFGDWFKLLFVAKKLLY